MHYELPPGVRSAQDLKFPDAVRIPKDPCRQPGRLLSTGPSTPPVLGFKCKKWGNGASNSSTKRRYHAGSARAVGKTATKKK